MKILPPIRNDEQGKGYFGARRGSRTHKGIDYAVTSGSCVLSPVTGVVTKLGYPYAKGIGGIISTPNEAYRYVEITTPDKKRHRVFYVHPLVEFAQNIQEDEVIGLADDISRRYTGMTPHVHYEIKLEDNTYIDPEEHE